MSELCLKLGFPPLTNVATFKSIAHLFTSTRKGSRCGIYLLELSDGCYYIGQSVEVVRRFSQHCRDHEIVAFSFVRTRAVELSSTERDKIQMAERYGLRMRNVMHTTCVAGEADLDLILSEQEQRYWVLHAQKLFKKDTSDRIRFPQSHLDRYAHKYQKFEKHPQAGFALKLLRAYVSNCLVAPIQTEYSFWNVSCMPSTGNQRFPRLFCVSAASMELFVVLVEKANPSFIQGFVTVSVDTLSYFMPLEEFNAKHPGVELSIYPYRDAGDDQITLRAYGAPALERLMKDKIVQLAAGVLSQRVMRKRPAFYAQYHCPQLAQQALTLPIKKRSTKGAASPCARLESPSDCSANHLLTHPVGAGAPNDSSPA